MSNGSGPNGAWTHIDELFQKQSVNLTDPDQRVGLMSNEHCPQWLLHGTLNLDTFPQVWEAAALNPTSSEEVIRANIFKFPELDNIEFWKKREIRVQAHDNLLALKEQEDKARMGLSSDRDNVIMRHILGTLPVAQDIAVKKNPVVPWSETEKYRVAMIMAPAWGVIFPPYGIAKLTALMRQQGYAVRVYDPNVEASHYLQDLHGIDYWAYERYFMWQSLDTFNNILLPDLEKLLDETINDVVNSDVRVVGFSMYNTNQNAVLHMAKKIRELRPDICLLVGGPGATMTGDWWFSNHGNIFNYIFVGESEEQLIYLLDNLPEERPWNKIVGTRDSRLSLEEYPYPDYTDYNLELYRVNGVSIETSRGCTAKCSFCAETHFWKFRSIDPERVVEEMEHQIKLHSMQRFWIVDSLINGNLKSFNRLLDLIIEKNLNIVWNSYSRCDGRMNLDFFKKIKQSGCTMLSFGIESGSQKILDDMHKKVKVWEILSNMRDAREAGLYIHSSWLQAFPTETPIDHLHSRQLIYNCRKWINAVSLGMGAGITPNSDMDTNWQAYDMQWKRQNPDGTTHRGAAEDRFLGDWYTGGYKNTVIHRFLRVKLMNIWMKTIMDHCPENIIDPGPLYADMDKFYTLEFKQRTDIDLIEQDQYIDTAQGVSDDYKGLILQDYLGFIYGLFQVYGELTWTFHCDPELDQRNFGEFLVRNYWCDITANIDAQGNYEMQVTHKFDHSDPVDRSSGEVSITGEVDYDAERARQNMSFDQTITLSGNFANWQSKQIQVEESVHPQYRKKEWKLEVEKESV